MTRETAVGHRPLDTALVEDGSPSSSHALAELLSERLHVAAIAVGTDDRIQLANRAAAALLIGPAGSLVGIPVTELLGAHPDLVHALTAARGGAGGTLDLTPSGEAEPNLHLTVLPVPGVGGGVLILIEAHASAAAEEDSTHRLAALGRLSAGMAHEIRNPLSGIGTNAQVLRRRFESGDPRVRFVDFILEEVTRLDKIIEDLLRFARPPEPRLTAHDLRESIDRAINLARGRIEKAGVEVRVEVEGAGELPHAYVDPDQIAQVLLNVVLNAVQAMPQGGELDVKLKSVERLAPVIGRRGRRAGDTAAGGPLRRFLELEVRDTGIGIDRADLPNLFEPFFTTRPSGTGLGLSTSQALLRQHGGAISVESELGKGTVVTILIPVEKRRGPR
jgi:signal transduction histidine kinase